MLHQLPFHPVTGLQAIGISKKGRPWWPIMGASDDHASGDEGDRGGDGDGDGGQGAGDLGFPANTPIKDMTAEQQAAYWKHHDRRKSDTLKSYGGITPEQAKQYKDAADAAARSQMSPADQALADARNEGNSAGQQEAVAQWAPQLAEAIVSQFVTDEKARPAVMAGLNPMSFVKDGTFDKDALIGHLTGLAAAFGGTGQQQEDGGTRQWGQSGDRPPEKSASEVGLAEAQRRGYVNKQ